jgi:predicted nucleotidyltransferase
MAINTAEIEDLVPTPHRHFIERFIGIASDNEYIVGVAIGGSYLSGSMDEFSDVDLVIAVDPDHYADMLRERSTIAESAGELLASFSGEHVGEPRLLICLYDNPLLHVDLKFVSQNELAQRVEDPAVLWERDRLVSRVIESSSPSSPGLDRQWIEDRFWVWIHYVSGKIGRGELFEAIDGLSFLRFKVLGPLCQASVDKPPGGVRKLETTVPHLIDRLCDTVSGYSLKECARALRSTVELYRDLRSDSDDLIPRLDAERAVIDYMSKIESRIDSQS